MNTWCWTVSALHYLDFGVEVDVVEIAPSLQKLIALTNRAKTQD